MGAILPIILSLLSSLPGILGKSFEKANQLAQLRVELERQAMIEQYKMGRAALMATGRTFKYITFCIWFGPFVLGIICPPWARVVFDNLKQQPDWYVQSCVMIMFTIWGISVSAPVVSNIFSNLGNYLSSRRADKIEMHRVNSDSYKKAFYEAMRAVKGNVSAQDVRINDMVLDKLAGAGNYGTVDHNTQTED